MWFLGGLALVVVVVAVRMKTQPSHFHIERSLGIDATAAEIFPTVAGFEHWHAWSPLHVIDPHLHMTHTGQGKGATLTWQGDSQVGEGRITVLDITEPTTITLRLDITKPLPTSQFAEITLLQEEDEGDVWTTAILTIHGNYSTIGKVMSIFFNPHKMIGRQLEQSLRKLKYWIEPEEKIAEEIIIDAADVDGD
jgi:hypothetical protein